MSKVINPDAAGIDIAANEHYIAVPEDRCKDNVRKFQGFTRDLHAIAKFLLQCNIKTVAMESTGVYWFQLYTILLEYEFEVILVNAYHVKNVPGRKSDISDARWLQQLHTFGLLNGCFQPENLTRSLRNYVRHRKQIIMDMSTETQRMQKALQLMNIKLNNVISDLHGKTGTQIIEQILQGERDPARLVTFRDSRIKVSRSVLIKSLEGHWREEHLFNLRLAFERYCFLQQQLSQCNTECEKTLKQMSDDQVPKKEIKNIKKHKNQPDFNVEQYLYNALGVDVTQIYGISTITALTIFSETGSKLLEKFPTEKQFLSWLNVIPDNKITGGKIIYSKVKKKKNKAGQAFREAAFALNNAQNPLADYLRIKKAKSGKQQAYVATARKLASIYYKMVTEKVEFSREVVEKDSEKYLKRKIKKLEKQLSKAKLQIADIQYV